MAVYEGFAAANEHMLDVAKACAERCQWIAPRVDTPRASVSCERVRSTTSMR